MGLIRPKLYGALIAFPGGCDKIQDKCGMYGVNAEQERGNGMNEEKKRQIRNEYKSKPAVGAIYALECSGNKRRCIKSTVDIEGLKNRFQFALSIKGCPDPVMTAEWKEYGSESFSLVVLEELKMKEDQTAREFRDDMKQLYELWLEKLKEEE